MANNNNNNRESSYRIKSMLEPNSSLTEQYRKLRTNIDYSTFNDELKIINLTSAMQNEGKTVTSLNLATVYSQSEIKTLLIDMDLRRPKIHRAFHVSNQKGLNQVILENLPLEQALHKVNDSLHILPSGGKLPFPVEFLMSTKVSDFISSLRDKYDKIIIDCPPLTAVADASIISKFSDGTLVVIASRNTHTDVALSILKTLRDNGANIIGSVLTKVRRKDERYMSGYYYYYSSYSDDSQ